MNNISPVLNSIRSSHSVRCIIEKMHNSIPDAVYNFSTEFELHYTVFILIDSLLRKYQFDSPTNDELCLVFHLN